MRLSCNGIAFLLEVQRLGEEAWAGGSPVFPALMQGVHLQLTASRSFLKGHHAILLSRKGDGTLEEIHGARPRMGGERCS